MSQSILFDPAKHAYLLPSLVSVHTTCITSAPYTIATFLPPLQNDLMTSWWQDCINEVSAGTRHIIMQMVSNPATGKEELAGYVMLDMPFAQTGPFRGGVQKLLVLPEYRKRGFARAMMEKLEEVAKVEERGLLTLYTEVGSPAELIYPRLGYIEVGVIPKYETSPLDGSLKDARIFYKDLRTSSKST